MLPFYPVAISGILGRVAPTLVSVVGGTLGAKISPIAISNLNLRDARALLAETCELAEPYDGEAGTASLTLPSAALGLTGSVPAGLRLSIDGDRFEVTADAEAGNDVIALTLAPIGEAVSAPYAAGTEVELDATVEFALPAAVEHGVSAFGLAPELVERAACRLLVPKAGAPARFRPQKGMVITGASAGTMILLADPQSTAGSWSLLLGRAS